MSFTGRSVLLARAVALAVLVAAPAARADGFTRLSDTSAETISDQLKGQMLAEGVPEELLGQLVKVEVADHSRCWFTAYNPHGHDLWNVGVTFQPTGMDKRTQHLMLLPAQSTVDVFFNCMGARGGSFDGIAIGMRAINDRLLGDMLNAEADTNFHGNGYTESRPGHVPARGALPLLKFAREGKLFVQRLMAKKAGPGLLAGFLAQEPPEGVVELVGDALTSRTDSTQVVALIAALLDASGERTSAVASLVDSQLGRVCAPRAGPGSGGQDLLWLKALKASGQPALQASVFKRCQPGGESLRRTVQVLTGSAELAGQVLEHSGLKVFRELTAALARSKAGHAALHHFLRTTADAGRFDTVRALLQDDELREAVLAVARSEQSSLAEYKSLFVMASLDKLRIQQPEAARALLLELVKLQASNEIPLDEMRAVLARRWSWAPEEAGLLLTEEVARRPTPFQLEGGKLPAGVEPRDYLFQVQPRLEGCDASLTRLSECAEVIAAHQVLVGSGLKPEFLSVVSAVLLGADPTGPSFRRVAREYSRWGLALDPVVEYVCGEAAREGHRREGGEDALLSVVAELKPEADCIAATRSELRWAAVEENATLTLKGLSLLLPVAGLVFLARWQLKPVQELRRKSLPDRSVLKGPGTVKSRLAGPGWQRGLEDALAEARKAFEEDGSPPGRAAAQALAGLREAVPVLAAQARAAASEAVTRGHLRSVLLQREGVVVYLVAVPARYEQPQTLRRFPGFTDGWTRHVERVARALPPDSAGQPLLGLVLFVEPDASQVVVVAGLEARGQRLLPGALLDEREAKVADGRVHPHRGSFALEAAPLAASAGDEEDSE
ncbi:hypothetical protein [Pyxidicoccus caerfyrddinensis]|uniref:hypothetical protein n=1 Tax=Pyxidicoccus caerfyrddinensis TaxID=2709663 RepID=UPI0013DD70C5|nr:hypothetical protein [Pyxidicoccus caerfyrddinensis]